MNDEKSVGIGETVQCRCPEGNCVLPDGLPADALAVVVASYVNNTHVTYGGKIFKVQPACVHPVSATFPLLSNDGALLSPPVPEQPPAT